MDEQVQLLTSIRDILTRIERVLERIEEGNAPSIAEAPAADPAGISAPSAAAPAAIGRPKWTKR